MDIIFHVVGKLRAKCSSRGGEKQDLTDLTQLAWRELGIDFWRALFETALSLPLDVKSITASTQLKLNHGSERIWER